MRILIQDLHGDFIQFCRILIYFKIVETIMVDKIYEYMYLPTDKFKLKIDLSNKQLIQLGDILDSKNRSINTTHSELKYSDMIIFIFLNKHGVLFYCV